MNILKKFGIQPTELEITKNKVWERIIKYIDQDDSINAGKELDLFYKLDKLEYF